MIHSGLPKLKKKFFSSYFLFIISITTKYFYSKAIKFVYVFSDINFTNDSDWPVYSLQEMYWASTFGSGGGIVWLS